MGRSFFDLLRREDGVVAVIFAVMAIPFIAMAGWAVDYVRLEHVKEKLQIEADAAALNALLEDAVWDTVKAAAKGEMSRNYNGNWADEIDVDGNWLNEVDFQVVATAEVPLAFIKILPGIGETQKITVSAVARLNTPDLLYSPPKFTSLSFEAHDFNRLWLYCFWPDRPASDPDLPQRTQMVPIADNGGSEFKPDLGNPLEDDNPIQDDILRSSYEQRIDQLDAQEQGIWRQIKGGGIGERRYTYLMPQCPRGSYLSMRLENVRNALQAVRAGTGTTDRWDKGGTRYDYYTDTNPTPGGPDEHMGLASVTLLETVICDTLDQCMESKTNGGKIPPTQKNREPQKAAEGCTEDRFMYYGWEDRPPELGGSDRDYDDIRVVMACPEEVWDGLRSVRLVS